MITIKVVAPFELKGVTKTEELQVPVGTTLHQMLRRVKAPLVAHAWPVAVNGCLEKKSYRLQEGDLVVFVAPLSGG